MAKRFTFCQNFRQFSCSYWYATKPQVAPENFNAIEKPKPMNLPKVEQISKKKAIDLKNTKGISVKHITKESENSALFEYCLERNPTADGFINAIEVFKSKNKTRQGHIDFIATGLKFIEPYGLQKDETVYTALMDVFPRVKFRNKTILDAFWPKQHPQINLALDILTKMEWESMIPPQEMHDLVLEIFGNSSFPLQKIYRMWFWMQELYNINPYILPEETYKDRLSVLKAVTKRFHDTEDGFEVLEISQPIEEDDGQMINYEHFLINSQTPTQKLFVQLCLPEQVLYIEGPYHVWMNHKMEKYFVLKNGRNGFMSDGLHTIDQDEMKEGVVLAMCFTTKPYKESLQRWWKHLQDTNNKLSSFNVVFNISENVNVIGLSHQLPSG